MTKRFLSPFLRFFALSSLVLLCLGLSVSFLAPGPAAQETGPRIWLDSNRPLAVTYTGGEGTVLAPGVFEGITPQPVAMAKGDFDQDGVGDLAVGFSAGSGSFIAVHRGNIDAFAPQSEASFQAIGHNQFPSPFLPQARTFAVPFSPDFIVAGDFTGHGHTDLAVASRGGSTLYVFSGDGKGRFTAGQTINLPGGVTSLGAGGLGRPEPVSNLLVGVSGPEATFLAVYGLGPQGLAPAAAFPLSAPATSIDFGEFGDMGRQDAIFLSGGQVFILRSSTMQLSHVTLPVPAVAFALGSFVFDRNEGSQIALLGADGGIQIAARNEFDPRAYTVDEFRAIRLARRNGRTPPLVPPAAFPVNGWKIVESFPAVGSVRPGQTPVFFRTRVSNQGGDDIVWLNASNGQIAVISHANVVPGAATFLPGQISLKPYSGSPVAAVSTRVNVDGRPGILALHQGQMAPQVSMPLPDPTFFVNRTDDPAPTSPIANACNNTSAADTSSSCSLREAVLKASGDTIMLQANTTYTLSIAKVTNDFSGNNGSLYVNNTVTIVGGNQNTTIIQAGTSNAAGVDKVMSVNEDINPITNASASISNLTMQNGHNRGTHGNDGDGGCMEFDTGSSGAATLSLMQVTLQNCSTTQGNGAGIAIFNITSPGAGAVTISNSIIQNNTASDSVTAGTGGGVWVSQPGRMSMSSSQVLNNHADDTNTTGGGGITTTSNVSGSPTVTIHASTISGNHTAGGGGGINIQTNMVVDQGTVISGNMSTSTSGGGGIFADLVAPDSVSLTKVAITGNKAPSGPGGGIFNGSGSGGGAMTISFSRLAGNSASTAGTANLSNDDTTITAMNNWWGTNTPASTIATSGAAGATSFDPFIVLNHTASPNKIRINQNAALTGDMSRDNHGSNAALSGNEDEIVGLPITFNNPVLGTIPQTQPEALGNPTPTATATYNAGGASGNGSADATVDQQTVTASIIVLQPPSITKTFSPKTIQTTAGTGTNVSTITFSVSNANTVAIDASFTDTLPANVGVASGSLVVASTPNVVNNCNGSVTATAGSSSISFSNTTLAVGTCTIQVNVQSAVDNIYSNSVTIDSTDAGNGNTSSDTLNVINPPHIAKAFNPTSVAFQGTSTLMLTVSNPNQNQTLSGISFTDTLPTGLIVATPSNLSSTCTGTASGAAGSSSVSLNSASLAPGASCGVSVTVQGAAVGLLNNSVMVSDATAGTGNTATASLTVNKANTSTAVASSSNPSIFGQAVTFTATVTDTSSSAVPTGSVQFVVDGVNFGAPVALTGAGSNSSTATSGATTTLSVAGSPHSVSANYVNADGNFNNSNSVIGNQTVTAAATATAVVSSSNPSAFGQAVTFTATVTDTSSAAVPTGSVQFVVDGVNFGSPVVLTGAGSNSSTASSQATATLLVAGSPHTVQANYVNADGNFSNSNGQVTGGQVVSPAATSTAVASSQNPSVTGQSVTFTATVTNSSTSPAPSGAVQFVVDGSNFGSPVALTAGGGNSSTAASQATTTLSVAGSPHTVRANYVNADGNFSNSNGQLAGGQSITAVATTTTVTASLGTITLGDTVAFTATVTAASGTPIGLVTFFDGNAPLGSATLQLVGGNSQASFSTSLLAAGPSHSVTATYQGAASFGASTSAPISETANPRGSTAGVVLNPTTAAVGQASTATVTLTDSGSVPPGTADAFSPTGAPATERAGFTSTLFADGLVLVAGGTNAGTGTLPSAEIFSVSGGSFSTTGNLNTARTGAVAVLLPTGKVLVAGGSSDGTANGALNTAEIFDPGAGTFALAGHSMTAARLGATATLLNNGKVLLAGGANSGGVLNSAELYDPAADTFTATGNLNSARAGSSATLLGSGKVLVAGGSSDNTSSGALNSAELFDPAGNSGAGTFTSVAGSVPTLAAGRFHPEAALLLSGKVLVAGGQNASGTLTSADLYDPIADSFTASAQPMSQARAGGSAVAMPNGMVLFAGGTTSQAVDLYDADSDRFDVTGSLQQSDNGLVATLLNNGQVLVTGPTSAAAPQADAELYSPSFNPLGAVNLSSSEATDNFASACVLVPSASTASTCTAMVTPVKVATSPHTITGAFSADGVHSASSGTASLTVNPASTTTTVGSSANPSVFGQSVTFTATVTDSSASSTAVPTGSVQFVVDGVNFGSPVALTGASSSSGTATSQATAALSVAGSPHTVTAGYVNADGNFGNSSGQLAGGQVVNDGNAAISLTSSQNPAASGQSVTFTATVSAVAPATGTPTGTVTFLDGGSSIGSMVLGGGTAALTTSSLAPGNHNITLNYSGDANFNGNTGSLSGNPQVVVAPPQIVKAFNPIGIQPNGVSTLAITLTNPQGNTVSEAGAAFTDNFPANLVVATPNNLVNTCGGTVTATAGTGTVSLSGGAIAVNSSCMVSVNVTSSFTGSYLNAAGPVSSTNGGAGGTASATLSVANPPTISKLFLPNAAALNGTTLLSFTITNPNSNSTAPNSDVTLTGIAFMDSLPAGLVVASPNQATNQCGGTLTATPGSAFITLTGGSLGPAVGLITRRQAKGPRPAIAPAANGDCSISVQVQASTLGTLNNTTGPISANESGAGAVSNTASLTVVTPPLAPTLAKAFGAASIPANTATTLTFTVTNPNAATQLSSIMFNDALPAGMTVAAASTSCTGGNVVVPGTVNFPTNNAIMMSGLTLNGGGSCSFSVNVMSVTAGANNNVTSNVVGTFDDGTGTMVPISGSPATATITVLAPDLAIAKSHSGNFTQGDMADTYQITVSNVGTAPTSGVVTVNDMAPMGLIPTNLAGAGWTCTVTPLSCNRSDALPAGSSYPPITLTTGVAATAPASVVNMAMVSGGGEVNTANDTATDTTTINQLQGAPSGQLTISLLVPSTQTIKNGGSASFVFDVVSHSPSLGAITFACQGLPANSQCTFSPQSENLSDAQVTMTVTTTADTASARPSPGRRGGPMLAAMLFPVLGLLSLAVAGRRGKKNRLRLAMFVGSLFVLMALFGCGGSPPHNGTPVGAFPVTVTATSSANPTVTASTQVVVTVQ